MKIAILILAAGSSSRMGTPKQLLKVGEKNLLSIAIENALNSNADKVVCVLGAYEKEIKESIIKYEIQTIVNSNFNSGLSSSIISGVNFLEPENFDAILISLGDQPFIDSNYYNLLIDTYSQNKEKCIASNYKKGIGVPAVFPKKYFNELLKLQGDKGAKPFLQNLKDNVIVIATKKTVDIDTLEDYAQLQKKYKP